MPQETTRRGLLGLTGALVGAGFAMAEPDERAAGSVQPFNFGICSYCVREFQRGLAINMMKQLGVRSVSVKDVHLSYASTPAEATKARQEFEKAGLAIVSGGTVPMTERGALRKYFEYAKRCGMPMMVTAPSHEALPEIEQLVKEYDIKIAIHTHGPEDNQFPNPQVVLEAVKGLDPRIGVCMDVGHTMRTGVDVVETVALCGTRLLDMHFKDLLSRTEKDSQCAVGRGVMPVVAIFKQLKKMGYRGSVDLEYEIHSDDPLPGMLESMAYMRGVAAGLA
jgi:sugar phosphate isomerase/epimerase